MMTIAISICENSIMMSEIHEGDVVRKLREERKWSRDRLASESHLRANTIGELEKYGARNLHTLRCVAKALGFAVEDIFCRLKELRINKHQQETSVAYSCQNPAHADQHIKLDEILNSDREDLIAVINASLDVLSASAAGDSRASITRRHVTLKELQESTSLPNSGEFIIDRSTKGKGGRRR